MRQLAKSVVEKLPPVARRNRQISRVENESRQLQQRLIDTQSDLAAAEGSLERALGRVADLRELTEDLKRELTESAVASIDREKQLNASREHLETQLERYQLRFERPSFLTHLSNYRDLYSRAKLAGSLEGVPIWQMPYKLRNYALAQSHGIATPEIYGVWAQIEDIDLGAIAAQRLVLKADGGHSGDAVFLLERTPSGWQSVDGAIQFQGQRPSSDITSAFGRWHGPYFAEEFLSCGGNGSIPEDIKVYCAYGEVLQVLLMQAPDHQSVDRKDFTRRYLGPDGEDLGGVASMGFVNLEIPGPVDFNETLEISRHLSRASGLPFIRVDLYDTPGGLVLGELTPAPGGRQRYKRDHDEFMGDKWTQALIRLQQDLASGRPPGTLFGLHAYDWLYPEVDDSHNGTSPNAWPRVESDCVNWCKA